MVSPMTSLVCTSKTLNKIKALMDESYTPEGLSISQVRHIVAQIKAGRDSKDCRGGSARKMRTPNFIATLKATIESDRRTSLGPWDISPHNLHGTP